MLSPDTVPMFAELEPIDRAVQLKAYIEWLDEEMDAAKAKFNFACAEAHRDGIKGNAEYQLRVRYPTGQGTKPDMELLRTYYPKAYDEIYDRQMKDFRPKVAKADLDWLFPDKEMRKEAELKISVTYPMEPQYVLARRD